MNKLKNYLYNIAMKSPLRKWALSLTGWKWWFYQIVVCGIIFYVIEYLINLAGLNMLPWRQKGSLEKIARGYIHIDILRIYENKNNDK